MNPKENSRVLSLSLTRAEGDGKGKHNLFPVREIRFSSLVETTAAVKYGQAMSISCSDSVAHWTRTNSLYTSETNTANAGRRSAGDS